MIEIDILKNIFITENIAFVSKSNGLSLNTKFLDAPRNHKFKNDIKDIYYYLIEHYQDQKPLLDLFFSEFSSLREMIYALKMNLVRCPRCKYCGDKLHFLENHRCYANTCNKSECIIKQRENSVFSKYGYKCVSQVPFFKEKIKETNNNLYGRDNPFQVSQFKEKSKKTCLEKYGVEYCMQNPEIKEKARQTCLEKYGSPNFLSSSFRDKNINLDAVRSSSIYVYDSITFDSSWELAFFIYCKDHNIPIERLPCVFEFQSDYGCHKYLPDFKIYEKELIEIKNPRMIIGNYKDPYHQTYILKPHPKSISSLSNEELIMLNNILKAKTECLKNNKVKIISSDEIKPYLKYIKDTYGTQYLKSFRKNYKNKGDKNE